MEYGKIESELKSVLNLVEKWQEAGAVALIEQNIALDELQKAYKHIMEMPANPMVAKVECDCHIQQSTTDEESIIEELEQIIEEQQEIILEQELVVEEPVQVTEKQEQVTEEMKTIEQPNIEAEKPEIIPEIRLFGQVITERQKKNYVFELFWRDEHYYNQEVAKLEAMPDLDTALIYISEKYNWSAQCPFAESFIALLTNKF